MTNRISRYVAAREAQKHVTYRVSPRGRFYVVRGKEIPEAEYLAANPPVIKPEATEGQKNNPCKKVSVLK